MLRATLRIACSAALLFAASTFCLAEPITGATPLPKTKVRLEQCLHAAVKEHAGTVVKLELRIAKGVPTYEFDIESPDGRAWDIGCDARTGKITEIEEEVPSATAPAFAAKMKVGEDQARQTALARHAGEVVEVEYEIESDGRATYEFDIRGTDGKEHKVEVDATTGEVTEDHEEIYQIGRETH